MTNTESLSLREVIRHLLNVFAVTIMLILIIKAKSYEVSWSWSYLLPTSWLTKVNVFLSSIGTLILIVPISIIITSYLIPNVKTLKIGTSLMSAGFGIYFMVQYIKNGFQIENIRNVFFTIHYIPTLEEKVDFFIAEWDKLLNSKTINTIARHDFLQSYFDSSINTGLKNQISATKMRFIPELVNNEFTHANQLFEETLKPSTFERFKNWCSNHTTIVKFGIGTTVAIVCAGVTIMSMNKDAIGLIIEGSKQLSGLVKRNHEVVVEQVQNLSAGIVKAIKSLTVRVAIQEGNLSKTNNFLSVFAECILDILVAREIITMEQSAEIVEKLKNA